MSYVCFKRDQSYFMKIHYLQHVLFEDAAHIEVWAKEWNIPVSRTQLFLEDFTFPSVDSFDWLIIMGGPMNIYEEANYPWLKQEKEFIKRAIDSKKFVLGICLGAQLIADVLGARVTKNEEKEIGWFPVNQMDSTSSVLFQNCPESFMAFHWHGDAFHIPEEAFHSAKSQICLNQAFEYKKRVFGLQFHLESTRESIQKLIAHCNDELIEARYIQSQEKMMEQIDYCEEIHQWNEQILNNILKEGTNSEVLA